MAMPENKKVSKGWQAFQVQRYSIPSTWAKEERKKCSRGREIAISANLIAQPHR